MKRFVSAAIAAIIPIVLIPTVQAALSGQAAANTCANDYTILVGGTGDPTSAGVPFQPIGEEIRIQYPASIYPVGSAPADMSVRVGRERVAAAVAGVRARCPGATIHAAGYSLGAWSLGDYCDTDASVKCTLIADPRNQGGINAYLPDLPGITFGGARDPRPNVVQVCGEYDVICSAPANDPVRLVASTIGYFAGFVGRSTHAYSPQPERDHGVVIEQASPIPFTDDVPALPVGVPTPRDVIQPVVDVVAPVVEEWTPATPVFSGGGYEAAPVADYLPAPIAEVVERVAPQVAAFVPPPLPVIQLPPLPRIPGL